MSGIAVHPRVIIAAKIFLTLIETLGMISRFKRRNDIDVPEVVSS